MPDILAKIIRYKNKVIAQDQVKIPLQAMKELAHQAPLPRNFFKAVTQPTKHFRIIAEVKKASPSAGIIRQDFDPVQIAKNYQAHGAAAISCLTDEKYFQGSLAYIQQIKNAVELPIIRKDFIIHPYQLYQARAAGADAVLLIAECIPNDSLLVDLLILASELKLTVLLEVHSMDNLLRVRPHIGFPNPNMLLGINNRDLKAMVTDINQTLRLADYVEDKSILISESGIRTHQDLQKLSQHGIGCALVGEHLIRQPHEGLALRKLLATD